MADWQNSSGYSAPFASPYVSQVPPPAPMPGQYTDQYAPSPNIQHAEPDFPSPLVYPVSPVGMSPVPSRDSSRDRRNTLGDPYIHIPDDRGDRERMYYSGGGSARLAVGASTHLSRSNSERSRTRSGSGKALVYVEVAKNGSGSARGRSGRSPSVGTNYYYEGGKKYTTGSVYSNSSFGSRSHSKVRHSRSPSCASCDSFEDHHHHDQYAVGPYRPKEQEEDLSAQLRKVQLQLEQVHAEADQRKKIEEDARLEKIRTEEIERKVQEQLMLQKKKEAEAAAEAKRKADAERAKIQAEAQKILEEREKAEQAKKAADEAEKAKIQAIIDAERQKYEAMNRGRRTYTKFSKVHLCKEALDERNIGYTEEAEHFLVHRVVDKTEQNYLWNRTKEIRNYYRQIQEAADKAPTVRTTDGSYVKYVQIAGQPYPIALPVTFTQTPGGGQTQRVDPIKIKWSDIFKPSKF